MKEGEYLIKKLDSKSYVFYTCSTQPSIPETLDFIGLLDDSDNQKLYVLSPSVLPKIRGLILAPFFSYFQRNFQKSEKRTSEIRVLIGKLYDIINFNLEAGTLLPAMADIRNDNGRRE